MNRQTTLKASDIIAFLFVKGRSIVQLCGRNTIILVVFLWNNITLCLFIDYLIDGQSGKTPQKTGERQMMKRIALLAVVFLVVGYVHAETNAVIPDCCKLEPADSVQKAACCKAEPKCCVKKEACCKPGAACCEKKADCCKADAD